MRNKEFFLCAVTNFSLFILHFSLKMINFAADKTKNFIFLAYESNY